MPARGRQPRQRQTVQQPIAPWILRAAISDTPYPWQPTIRYNPPLLAAQLIQSPLSRGQSSSILSGCSPRFMRQAESLSRLTSNAYYLV